MSATVTYIRTYLARVVIIVGVLAMLISYYFVNPTVSSIATEMRLWNTNIGSFSLFVGLISIFARYGRSIMNRAPNWYFHLYCLAVIVIWLIFGWNTGIYADIYQKAYLSTKITLHITIIGQLIFFCVSAMYRTSRVRSLRSAVFVFFTVLIIVLNAPWMLTPYPQAGNLSTWLLDNVQMAPSRAMVLCGGIGGLILSMRIIMGLEKGALRVTGE